MRLRGITRYTFSSSSTRTEQVMRGVGAPPQESMKVIGDEGNAAHDAALLDLPVKIAIVAAPNALTNAEGSKRRNL